MDNIYEDSKISMSSDSTSSSSLSSHTSISPSKHAVILEPLTIALNPPEKSETISTSLDNSEKLNPKVLLTDNTVESSVSNSDNSHSLSTISTVSLGNIHNHSLSSPTKYNEDNIHPGSPINLRVRTNNLSSSSSVSISNQQNVIRTRHGSFSATSTSSLSKLANEYNRLGRSISPSPSSSHSTDRTYSPLRRHGSANLPSRNPNHHDLSIKKSENISNNGKTSGSCTPRERGASLGADIGDIAIEAAVAVLEADALHSQQRLRSQSHSNSFDFSNTSNPPSPFVDALDSVLDNYCNININNQESLSNSLTNNPISPNTKYHPSRNYSNNRIGSPNPIHTTDRKSSNVSPDHNSTDGLSDSDDSDEENNNSSIKETYISSINTTPTIEKSVSSSSLLSLIKTNTDENNDSLAPPASSESLQKLNTLLSEYHEKTLQKLQFREQHSTPSAASNLPLHLQPERIPRIPLTSTHPNWANDTNCQHCGIKFTMLRRKHHCRGCGCVLCSACSPHNTSSLSSVTNSSTAAAITPFTKAKIRVCRRCRALQSGRVLRATNDPNDSLSWLDAIASGDMDEIETRIIYGQDVNAVCTEDDNFTALHIAAGITSFYMSQQRLQSTSSAFTSFIPTTSPETINNTNTISTSLIKKTTSSPILNDTSNSGRQSPLLSSTNNNTNGVNDVITDLTISNNSKNPATLSAPTSRSPFFASFGSAISKLAGFSLSSSPNNSDNNAINQTNGSGGPVSVAILDNDSNNNATNGVPLSRSLSTGTESSMNHSTFPIVLSPLSINTPSTVASLNSMNMVNIQSWWENRTEAERISINIIQLLLREGANINAQSASRRTPLHIAAMHGTVRTIQILLETGALQSIKDKNGFTPYDYAELRASKGDAVGKYLVEHIFDPTYSNHFSDNHTLLLQSGDDAAIRRTNMLMHIRTHLLIRAKLQQTSIENETFTKPMDNSNHNSPLESVETTSTSTNPLPDTAVSSPGMISSNSSPLSTFPDIPSNFDPSIKSLNELTTKQPEKEYSAVSEHNSSNNNHNLNILSLVSTDETMVGIASGESSAVLSEASMLSRAQSLPLPSKDMLVRMNIQALEPAAQTLQANLMSVREGYERYLHEQNWMDQYTISPSVLTNQYNNIERMQLGPIPAIDIATTKEWNMHNSNISSVFYFAKLNRLGLLPISSRYELGWLRLQELIGKVWSLGHPTSTYGDATEYIETAFRQHQGINYIRPVGLCNEYMDEYDNDIGEEGGPEYDPDNAFSYQPHREILDDERSQISDLHDGSKDEDSSIIHRTSIHRRRTISTLSSESSVSSSTTDLDSSTNSEEMPSLNSSTLSSIDHDTSVIADNNNHSQKSPSKDNNLDSSTVSARSENSGVLHVSLDAFINGTVLPVNTEDQSLLSVEVNNKPNVPVSESTVESVQPSFESNESINNIIAPPPLKLSNTLSPLRLTPPSNNNRSKSAPESYQKDSTELIDNDDDDTRSNIIREDGKLQISINTEGTGLTQSLSRLRLNTDPEVAAHLRAKALQEEVDRESLASLSPRSMSFDGNSGLLNSNAFEISPGNTNLNISLQPFSLNPGSLLRTNSLGVGILGRSTSVDTGFSPLMNTSSPGIRSILKRTGSFMSPSMNTNPSNIPTMSPMTLTGMGNNNGYFSSPTQVSNNTTTSTPIMYPQISPSMSLRTDSNSSLSTGTMSSNPLLPTPGPFFTPPSAIQGSIAPARSVRLSATTSFELPPSAAVDSKDNTDSSSTRIYSSNGQANVAFQTHSSFFDNTSMKNGNNRVNNTTDQISPNESESMFYFGGNLTRSSSDNSVSPPESVNNNYSNSYPYQTTRSFSMSDSLSKISPSLENLAPARSPSLSFASVSSAGSGLRRNVSFRERGGSVVSDVFTYDRKARRTSDDGPFSSDEENDSNNSVNGSDDDDNKNNGGSGGEDTDSESGHDNPSTFKNTRMRSSSPTGFLSSGARTSRVFASEGINAEGSQTSRSKESTSTKVISAIPSRLRTLLAPISNNEGESTTEDEDMTEQTRATAALTSSSSLRNNSFSLRSSHGNSNTIPIDIKPLSNISSPPLSPMNVSRPNHISLQRSLSVPHSIVSPTSTATSATHSSKTSSSDAQSISLNLKASSSNISVRSRMSDNSQEDKVDDLSSASDEGYRTDSDDDIEEEAESSDNVEFSTRSSTSSNNSKGSGGGGAPKAIGGPPVAQLTPKMMAIIASMAASRNNPNNAGGIGNGGQSYYGQQGHQNSHSTSIIPPARNPILSAPASIASTSSSITSTNIDNISIKPKLSLTISNSNNSDSLHVVDNNNTYNKDNE